VSPETALARAARLIARAEPVAWDRDLFDALGPDGFAWFDGTTGFATRGIAARIPADAVEDALAAIRVDGDIPEAARPRAVGALPFASDASATLSIPAHMLTLDANGGWWNTTVALDGDELTDTDDEALAADPGQFTVRRSSDETAWRAMVQAALAAIDRDELTKVVLAREAIVEADAPFDVARVLTRLRAQNGACFIYADATGPGIFVGASPELLVQRSGSTITSRPMAGTTPVSATDTDTDAINATLHTLKHEHEHQLVVDAVVQTLTAHGVRVTADTAHIVKLATVAHLATEVHGTIAGPASALQLARALHPTPAVGGTPTDSAITFINAHEAFDRGRYAGPVGWTNAAGDGTFAVALRCAELHGTTARLFAGAGIVAGSDPASEWTETQAKLEPMLRALVRP
jgi:isochorismate synthase